MHAVAYICICAQLTQLTQTYVYRLQNNTHMLLLPTLLLSTCLILTILHHTILFLRWVLTLTVYSSLKFGQHYTAIVSKASARSKLIIKTFVSCDPRSYDVPQ